MSDDYSANVQTTGAVAVGGSATGTIETAHDQDWFAVELVAGRTYQFDLGGSPSGGGTLSDTFLRAIYDSEGRYQSDSYNDDFGGSRDSRVTFTASQSGTYYVRASGDRDETGSYTLRVSDVTPGSVEDPPPVEPPAETVAPEEPGPARAAAEDLGDITELAAPRFPLGTLDGGGDAVAWYRFTLSEAREVALGLRRQDADADLVLEDAAGNVLHSSERSGTANEWLRETLLAGTYYVRVEAQEAGANAYVFRYGVGDADPAEVTRLEAEQESVQEQVQQQPPAFGSQFYGFDLPENTDGSANRISLGTVSATDPDGGSVTYSIEGGNAARLFEIDAASGELFYTGGGEDYETGSTSFELTVRASDGDQTTDTTATVSVTDVDELVEVDPPVAQPDQSTPQTVSEPAGEDFSAGASTSGRVAVGDTATGNVGSNGDRDWFAVELVAGRTYVIDLRGSPTDDGTLSDPYLGGIHDSDGNLIPRTTNDDGGQGYNSRVTFTATGSGTHYIVAGAAGVFSGQGTYEVEVTDTSPPIVAPDPDSEDPPDTQEQVQQQLPAFGSQFYGFELPENTDGSANRISLGTVSVTGPDGGSVTYSIEGGNAARLFEIDAASGEVFYTGGGEDHETGSTSFELTVRASDGDQTTDTTVTISVTDVAEAPAFGQAGYGFDLAENADGSTDRISLGAVSATDPDGGSVTYSIAGGNAAGQFEIDAASGELFYVGAGEDYETGSTSFELTVRASDGDETTDTTVTVNVTDAAEAPAFGQASYAFDLAENTNGSTNRISLGAVSATDPDGGSVTYSIVGGNESGSFEIDTASGELFHTGGGEDYETGSTSFELTVRASDGDQTTDTTATVSVTDVAEAPAFGQAGYGFDLAENADGSTNRISLGSVSATDPDGGSVTYSIEDGNAARLFEIDAASGELFYVGAGEDYETGSTSFELTVRASDGDETTDTTVTVNVTDVDEPVEVDPPVTEPDQSTPQTVSEPAGEDFARNSSTSGRVAVGDTATGRIGSSGDRDWFAVELVAGRTYVIDLRGNPTGDGTLRNPYLRGIYDADGNRISNTTDDDGGQGYNSRVTFTATESGTHYIAAGAYSYQGTYELEVTDTSPPETPQWSEPDGEDFPARTSTTGRVAVGGSATGNIDSVIDRDWFAVDLWEGSTYVIDLRGSPTGTAAGTLSDPYLHGIYDADGDRISNTTDDDGGHSYNSRVTLTATESGTHYIAAGADFGRQGTYTLAVSKVTDGLSADTDTNGEVTVGGTATGEIEFAGDVDWFAVTLEAGKTYRFDLEGAWGILSSPFLRGLYDATGARIEGTTDSSGGLYRNTQLYFTPTTGGTYYVAAGASGDLTGTYTLGVAETAEDVAADTGTAATVAVGGTVTGEIESPDDRDWYAVTLEAGKTYRFDLVGGANQSGHTLWDPHLWGLHDATGALIDGTTGSDVGTTGGSNGGPGRNSRLNFTADTSGTYYVAVGAIEGPYRDDTGSYSLAVDDITEDIPADTSTTATVSVSGPEGVEGLLATTGRIETVRDRDWFAVTLKAGKTYRIDLEGSFTDKGTLYDPHIVGIYDANGDRIDGTIKGGGIGYNSHRYVTVDADGTYYVAAGTYLGPYVGSYTLEVTQLVADAAADSSTTATVTVGNPETGDIETLGDRDWYAVTLEEGKTYRIDLEGTPTHKGTLEDPYLRGIYDTNGVLIDGTTDDYGGWYNNSRVYFTAPANGTYYLSASSAHDNYVVGVGQNFGRAAGTYVLSITELLADVAADTATTATLTVGSTISGEIEFAGDSDWFAVTLEEGKTYRFDLEGRWPIGGPPSKGTLTYPHLRGIYDASGVFIDSTTAENSGGYLSGHRSVYFTADASGTYYVSASGHYWGKTGTYVLTATELEDDFFANTSTTATVAVGGTATGEIEFTGDRDWFAVTLEAGKTYQINLAGETTDKGTLQDPYLRGIHDATGALIADTTDDDGGSQKNSRVEFTAATSGTYYVAAGAFDDLTGSYTLAVETDVAEAPAFAQAGYTFDLAEDTDGSVARLSLGTVSATDPDGGSVTYSIAGGNAAALFEIDAASGELFYVGGGEDYETGSTSFELTVRASDGEQATDATVTVNVTDVEDSVEVNPPFAQTVSEPSGEDFPANPSTSGRVAVGDTATGRIGSSGDRDWFAVELEAGREYQIDLKGSPTGDGTLSDPYFRGVYDEDGNVIPGTVDDDGGEGYNSRETFTADADGTYYLAAGAFSSPTGTYTLSVEEVVDGI